MGVAYKLRQDVVFSILQLKKEEPSLSCRKITAIIKERFDLTLSKSSVNDILKNSQLSSRVGRRPLKASLIKKFELPATKKLVSFSHSSLEPEKKSQGVKFPAISLKEKTGPDLNWDCGSMSLSKIEKSAEVDVSYFENVGTVFLKVAEWFLFASQPLLMAFLPKGCQISPSVAEVLEYMGLYGVDSVEKLDNYKMQDLWVGLGSTDQQETIRAIKNVNLDYCRIITDIRKTIPFLLKEVEYCQIVNKIGHAVFISGDFEVLSEWKIDEHKCPKTHLLSKIKNIFIRSEENLVLKWLLSERFTNNRLNIDPAQFVDKISKTFLVFSDKADKSITQILVFDDHGEGEELRVLPKKRYILGGVSPDPNLLAFLLAGVRGEVERSRSSFQQEDFIMESALLSDGGIRIIVIKDAQNTPQIILLTNNEAGKTESLAFEYLSRFHNALIFNDMRKIKGLQPRPFDPLQTVRIFYQSGFLGNGAVKDLQWVIMEFLNYYVVSRLFSFDSAWAFAKMQKQYYSLPGRIIQAKDYCQVELLLPKECVYREEIIRATSRVNRMGVKDLQGRFVRLYLR